ncbi:MAG: response regulator [Gemmatimonadota bacterium]|nr:response regulator [Gemmatimonadota bacterium]MDP7032756.1 response regulator [Gemmatimonadota bacterium]
MRDARLSANSCVHAVRLYVNRESLRSVEARQMPGRLLILMDDEPVTTRALALDLSEAGYEVETAVDEVDALRRFDKDPYDLVIAAEDAGSGGGGFVKNLRLASPSAKVVVMTTRGGRRERVRMEPGGARVRKPFDLDEFRLLVDRLLASETTGESGKTM